MATATILLPVESAKLPSTAAAGIDGGNDQWYLLFDDTTVEKCRWQFRMPGDYSSGLTSKIQYCMATATSGLVAFNVYIMAISDGDSADIDTDSFDSANVGYATVPGTAGYLDEISTSLSNVDSVAAGDLVVVRLERAADQTSIDTATGDAKVATFSLTYTTT